MELLKLAIKYYIKITGLTCDAFYEDLDKVCIEDISTQTGDAWLRHKLVEQAISNGLSLNEILSSKTDLLQYFGRTYISDIQEYDVESVWGKEVSKILTNNIANLGETVVWYVNCLSDSLITPLKLNKKQLFMSHNSKVIVKDIADKRGTVFQYDFLANTRLAQIPEPLRTAIETNKPIVFLCCVPLMKEPLKSEFSDEMYDKGLTTQSNDVYYQTLYRFIKLVKEFGLTHSYLGFFGDNGLYTKESNKVFANLFRETFSFIDGFCFSLKDFNSVLLNTEGMHFSLWGTDSFETKPIILTKKRLLTKTKVEDGEQVLFEHSRVTITEWLKPDDVLFYNKMPVMLNYATFKGREKFEKVAISGNKMAENAVGTISITDNMKDIKKTMLLSSVPSGNNYINITEENFWRVVAAFAFSCLVTPTWNNNNLRIFAPNTYVEDYDKWCKNALLLCLFDKNAMFSNLRNVQFEGITMDIENKLFFVNKAIMEMSTSDMLILQQLEKASDNDFFMKRLNEARPYWDTVTVQLYEFCMDFVQRTLDRRKDVRYAEDLDSWNAGFSQIRSVFGKDDMLFKANFDKLFIRYTDYLRPYISKFGFLQD